MSLSPNRALICGFKNLRSINIPPMRSIGGVGGLTWGDVISGGWEGHAACSIKCKDYGRTLNTRTTHRNAHRPAHGPASHRRPNLHVLRNRPSSHPHRRLLPLHLKRLLAILRLKNLNDSLLPRNPKPRPPLQPNHDQRLTPSSPNPHTIHATHDHRRRRDRNTRRYAPNEMEYPRPMDQISLELHESNRRPPPHILSHRIRKHRKSNPKTNHHPPNRVLRPPSSRHRYARPYAHEHRFSPRIHRNRHERSLLENPLHSSAPSNLRLLLWTLPMAQTQQNDQRRGQR